MNSENHVQDEMQTDEAPHCLQRQADQFEAMDDMGAWAQTHPIVIGEVAE